MYRRFISVTLATTTVVATLLTIAGPVRADDAETIRQLEQQLADAVVEGDVATFDRLFAEDFTHGSQSGRFRTKDEWMKGKQQGESAYVSFDSANLQVHVSGDTAVVTGSSRPSSISGN